MLTAAVISNKSRTKFQEELNDWFKKNENNKIEDIQFSTAAIESSNINPEKLQLIVEYSALITFQVYPDIPAMGTYIL